MTKIKIAKNCKNMKIKSIIIEIFNFLQNRAFHDPLDFWFFAYNSAIFDTTKMIFVVSELSECGLQNIFKICCLLIKIVASRGEKAGALIFLSPFTCRLK